LVSRRDTEQPHACRAFRDFAREMGEEWVNQENRVSTS
jgi:hypothetical protein